MRKTAQALAEQHIRQHFLSEGIPQPIIELRRPNVAEKDAATQIPELKRSSAAENIGSALKHMLRLDLGAVFDQTKVQFLPENAKMAGSNIW